MMIVAAAEIQGLANNDVQVGKGLLTQDLVHEVQEGAVRIQQWKVSIQMDLDAQDKKERELDDLIQVIRNEVKEIAFKVSSTDQSIYLQALEADGLQLENEETKVSQGMATEELKALRELVDNQFQSSKDVLGPFYKQGEDAFLNYQKRFDLYKCNQRLKLQTFQNQVMNKTFQIDQYEKNLEALKSERRLKLESLMEQNKASEDEIKRLTTAIAEPKEMSKKFEWEKTTETAAVQSTIYALNDFIEANSSTVVLHGSCSEKITKSRESYAKSVENLQMELRIVEEENTYLRGDVTKFQTFRDQLLNEIDAVKKNNDQTKIELLKSIDDANLVTNVQQQALKSHLECSTKVESIKKEIDEIEKAISLDAEKDELDLVTKASENEANQRELSTCISHKEDEILDRKRLHSEKEKALLFYKGKVKELRALVAAQDNEVFEELSKKERLKEICDDSLSKMNTKEKEVNQLREYLENSRQLNERLEKEELLLRNRIEEEQSSIKEANESILKMQESLAFFEREKVAEIKKLQADLSTSEELAKHKRWAYDEHMLCQQKITSTRLSNSQTVNEIMCESESVRKNNLAKKEEYQRLESTMSNKAGNAEKLLREKSDRIEHLKKSLMEADEKNKALMEFVFEHKMCQQKLISLQSEIDQKKSELDKTNASFDERAFKSSKENEALTAHLVKECENLKKELSTEKMKEHRLSGRHASLLRELEAKDIVEHQKEVPLTFPSPIKPSEPEFVAPKVTCMPTSSDANGRTASKPGNVVHEGTPRPVSGKQNLVGAKKKLSSVTNFVWDNVEEDDDDDPFSLPKEKSLKTLGKYRSSRSVGAPKESQPAPPAVGRNAALRRKLFVEEKSNQKRSYTRTRGRKSEDG